MIYPKPAIEFALEAKKTVDYINSLDANAFSDYAHGDFHFMSFATEIRPAIIKVLTMNLKQLMSGAVASGHFEMAPIFCDTLFHTLYMPILVCARNYAREKFVALDWIIFDMRMHAREIPGLSNPALTHFEHLADAYFRCISFYQLSHRQDLTDPDAMNEIERQLEHGEGGVERLTRYLEGSLKALKEAR